MALIDPLAATPCEKPTFRHPAAATSSTGGTTRRRSSGSLGLRAPSTPWPRRKTAGADSHPRGNESSPCTLLASCPPLPTGDGRNPSKQTHPPTWCSNARRGSVRRFSVLWTFFLSLVRTSRKVRPSLFAIVSVCEGDLLPRWSRNCLCTHTHTHTLVG